MPPRKDKVEKPGKAAGEDGEFIIPMLQNVAYSQRELGIHALHLEFGSASSFVRHRIVSFY